MFQTLFNKKWHILYNSVLNIANITFHLTTLVLSSPHPTPSYLITTPTPDHLPSTDKRFRITSEVSTSSVSCQHSNQTEFPLILFRLLFRVQTQSRIVAQTSRRAGRTAGRTTERTAGRAAGRTTGRTAGRTASRTAGRAAGRVAGRAAGRIAGRGDWPAFRPATGPFRQRPTAAPGSNDHS